MANHTRKLSGKKKAKVFHSTTINGKEVKVSAPWYRSPHRRPETHRAKP